MWNIRFNVVELMRKIIDFIERWLSDIDLKKKLNGLYLFCVLIPLFFTDGFILWGMVRAEQAEKKHQMERVAEAVEYNLRNVIDDAANDAVYIAMNNDVADFLNKGYTSPYNYVDEYQDFIKNSVFERANSMGNYQITVYAKNNTIVNGGTFRRLDTAVDEMWYKEFVDSGQNMIVRFFYDDMYPVVDPERKLVLISKTNLASHRGREKIIKIEMDYSSVIRDIMNMNYEMPIYICCNNQVMMTNTGKNPIYEDYYAFEEQDKVGYKKEISMYDYNLNIYVLNVKSSIFEILKSNIMLVLLLVIINVLLPWVMMKLIERSVTGRVRVLGEAFDCVEDNRLMEISDIYGDDEIGRLMNNYNRMALRMNTLIQTVYMDRLKEQEMDIARRNAELMALHSQINPHFLFNALESIRMHSVLKKEYETADMVQKLALMHRQNVDWGKDKLPVIKEIEFADAYLALQKYRFGNRLSYSFDIDEKYRDLEIPKLSIVTFVENACVHGIEKKATPGWIFVKVYGDDEYLYIEVEDTGAGMSDDKLHDMQEKIKTVNIDMLKEQKSVGILNACLRIKMMTDDASVIGVDSEEDIGTTIIIKIPINKLHILEEL